MIWRQIFRTRRSFLKGPYRPRMSAMQSSDRTESDVTAVAEVIRSNDRFMVVAHENPDGDALGSMLGATLGLRALGKDVVMYLYGSAPTPGEYRFLDLDDLQRELPDDLEDRVLLAVD